MTKYIITYILFIACLLSACRTDNYDFEPETDVTNDGLTLTVSASDIVVSDGITSRVNDDGKSTVFEEGNCVGLIILDSKGNLLADNVPYKFDGSDWHFDADNKEGKQRVYYDATMSTYIVYYPYHESANGIADVSALKSLPIFAHQKDQTKEEVYRYCDLMVWTESGKAQNHLSANLKHVHNSFSLDIKLNWELPGLPSDNHLEYRPLTDALIDFKVRLEDGTLLVDWNEKINKTFHAEDRSYRYILPDGYTGKITWRYTYRGETYAGESDVSAEKTGVRHVQHTSADISPEKAEPYDYYSYKTINGKNYGFVMPWDAEECFDQYKPIGIVFYVGQHIKDGSDYTRSGIDKKECRGYVLAIADAFLPDAEDKPNYTLSWTYPDADNNMPIVTGITNNKDWSGYANLIKMREFSNGGDIVDRSIFPAAYACETFSGLDGIKMAPSNTSGWFLPTYGMLHYIMNDSKFDSSFGPVAKYVDTKLDESVEGKTLFNDFEAGYWSSTEFNVSDKDTYREYYFVRDENGNKIPILDANGKQVIKNGVPQFKEDFNVITTAERFPAYFLRKSKSTSATNASKKDAKYVRPVLAF